MIPFVTAAQLTTWIPLAVGVLILAGTIYGARKTYQAGVENRSAAVVEADKNRQHAADKAQRTREAAVAAAEAERRHERLMAARQQRLDRRLDTFISASETLTVLLDLATGSVRPDEAGDRLSEFTVLGRDRMVGQLTLLALEDLGLVYRDAWDMLRLAAEQGLALTDLAGERDEHRRRLKKVESDDRIVELDKAYDFTRNARNGWIAAGQTRMCTFTTPPTKSFDDVDPDLIAQGLREADAEARRVVAEERLVEFNRRLASST